MQTRLSYGTEDFSFSFVTHPCESGTVGAVEGILAWSAPSDSDPIGSEYTVYAAAPEAQKVIFARGARVGSAETGAWVLSGHQFWLERDSDGAEIAQLTVGELCGG